MLTISEIALKYKISNKQVNDLVDYGFLPISYTERTPNRGVRLLFSELDVIKVDIPSALAEIKQLKEEGIIKNNRQDFKKMIKVINYYDKFLENIAPHPNRELLQTAFYLFHLNHYAKKYTKMSNKLYKLKNQTIRKMHLRKPDSLEMHYLIGPDRKTIWLCEDCKYSSQAAGMPYGSYIRQGNYCPKCYVQSVEKEYYSLIEFIVLSSEYRFVFHLPLNTAKKWLENINDLPQGFRKTKKYDDKMYLYGRQISRIEEKAFPLNMIVEKLENYLAGGL